MKHKRRLSRFGRSVVKAMKVKRMTLNELADEVERKTERFFTAAYLRRIMHGQRAPGRFVDAIREVLGLELTYKAEEKITSTVSTE